MSRLYIILYFLLFLSSLTKAQDSSRVKVYKKNKFEILGMDEHITLYKKVNTQKYYFSPPYGRKLKRLNYYRIIHKNASTYKIRENCRELRRRKIKLYQKHKDGEYYIFKVFNSFIQ